MKKKRNKGFFLAAMRQKSMVTSRIFKSGNKLAGISIDYGRKGFRGMRDFRRLVEEAQRQEQQQAQNQEEAEHEQL